MYVENGISNEMHRKNGIPINAVKRGKPNIA